MSAQYFSLGWNFGDLQAYKLCRLCLAVSFYFIFVRFFRVSGNNAEQAKKLREKKERIEAKKKMMAAKRSAAKEADNEADNLVSHSSLIFGTIS